MYSSAAIYVEFLKYVTKDLFLHMSSSFMDNNKTSRVDASKFIEGIQWLLEDGFSRLGISQRWGFRRDSDLAIFFPQTFSAFRQSLLPTMMMMTMLQLKRRRHSRFDDLEYHLSSGSLLLLL